MLAHPFMFLLNALAGALTRNLIDVQDVLRKYTNRLGLAS